jgi:hypothetical protein
MSHSALTCRLPAFLVAVADFEDGATAAHDGALGLSVRYSSAQNDSTQLEIPAPAGIGFSEFHTLTFLIRGEGGVLLIASSTTNRRPIVKASRPLTSTSIPAA